MSESPASSPPSAPASSGSPLRLIILIALLLVVVGLFAYDRLVADPGSEAAYDHLEKFVEQQNAKGVSEAKLVHSADVQKALGMAPTFVDEHDDYTIEYYCWFGKIPVLNTWKRYLTVVYVSDSRRYDAHYKNQRPPEDSLPGYVAPVTEGAGDVETVDMGPEGAGGPPPESAEGGGGKKKGGKKKGGDAPGDAPAGDAPTGDAPAGDTPAGTETPAPESTEPAAPPADASPESTPAEPPPVEPAASEDQPEAEAPAEAKPE